MSQILRIAEAEEADAESHGTETKKINTESNEDGKAENEKVEEKNLLHHLNDTHVATGIHFTVGF